MGKKKEATNQPFNEQEENQFKLFRNCNYFTIEHDDTVGLSIATALQAYLEAKHSKKLNRCKKVAIPIPVPTDDLISKSIITEKFP